MPYHIEVMGVGADIYSLLEHSVQALNGVQNEFRFYVTAEAHRPSAIAYQREQYGTSEVFDFLRQQLRQQGGHRPYIIAFITRPLSSQKYSNLFGSHEAKEGLAMATIFGTGQYVREETRYCCYYLVRYALSFVNPLIKTHNDEPRKSCYFHRKIYKPDIRASMDSGHICDECLKQLDNPPRDLTTHRLSDAEREALLRMRKFVSGDLPYAIVLKGGGVKGLAFAGALLEIERHFYFDRHVGTSAGAIAAILLAAGYKPTELRDILLTKNFRDFLDASFWKATANLIFRQGCFPGDSFVEWLSQLLATKLKMMGEVPMKRLDGAVVYASRRGSGLLPFDSKGERKETGAASAARCSMSIPLVFVPEIVDRRRVFDGGLLANFPLTTFLKDHYRSNFIALYLGKPDHKSKRFFGRELLDIIIDRDDFKTVDENSRSVVVIDTSPIGTIDFGMTAQEKEFLLKVGKAAALQWLVDRKLDDGPAPAEADKAMAEAEAARMLITTLRKRQRVSRISWAAFLIAIFAALYMLDVFAYLSRVVRYFVP